MSVRIDQEYEVVGIDEDGFPLKEHPRNPRRGDEEMIEESIDENGWYGAVTCQKSTGYILAGNHRFRVARKKGLREIPVIWRDVDDETALKILLVDNKSADAGDYDEALLEELLQGLESLDGTGYVLRSAQETIERQGTPVGTGGTSMAAKDHGKGVVPEADPPAPGANPASLPPDEIPEDKYEPSFAVIIVCKSERQQEETYRWLQEQMPKRKDQIRLTAV
jgi:hypothetical protein